MDLRDLRYFDTIAELEHLGKAAERVHRSPPALTKCIRRLEESLGTPLFERAGRGIRLTAAGRVLQRRAKLLDVAMDDTLREIGAVSRGVSGHVRVGVAPTIAQYLLPGACRAFLAGGDGVTIETLIAMSTVLRDALQAGEIDMAITVERPADQFIAHPIVEDIVVVVAGTDHEIFRKRATVADLARYRWVLPVASYDTEIRSFVDTAFRRHGLPPPSVQIETNSVTLLPNMIAATGLLSFLSRRNLGRGHVAAPLREVKLKEMTMRRRFALLQRKDGYLSPAALRFVDLLMRKGQTLFAKG
jgi:DNA-binding transcriptional LysR family regulator